MTSHDFAGRGWAGYTVRMHSNRYFPHISQSGPVRYGDVPGSIGVLEPPDQFMPVGEAHGVTWNQAGLAVWRLILGKAEVPGRWVIIDRQFRQA